MTQPHRGKGKLSIGQARKGKPGDGESRLMTYECLMEEVPPNMVRTRHFTRLQGIPTWKLEILPQLDHQTYFVFFGGDENSSRKF